MSRSILHLDLDAFFAAVAVLDDPTLAGKPVLVGGTGPRSVVTTASYEARVFGCRSAMPMSTARRLCPHAVLVKVPGQRIRELSQKVFEIINRFSPLVQKVGVDEGFIDLTGTQRLLGEPPEVASRLRQQVLEETGLSSSVGVSFCKSLAKLASELGKPGGVFVIGEQDVQRIMDPMPVGKLWGVGPTSQKRLQAMGITTVGDVRRASRESIIRRLGDWGGHLHDLAHGIDPRAVTPDRVAKSIGHEHTFGQDVAEREHLRWWLLEQTEDVARRVRQHGLRARGVTVKLRYGDFETITRSTTLTTPTDRTEALWAAASGVFDAWCERSFQPLRLIGMSAGPLSQGDEQMGLFTAEHDDRQRQVDATLDKIAERFGRGAVKRGPTRG